MLSISLAKAARNYSASSDVCYGSILAGSFSRTRRFFTAPTDYISRRRQLCIVNYATAAPASSSTITGIDYREKLMRSRTSNQRLEDGVSRLRELKRKEYRVPAALLRIVMDYVKEAETIKREHADFLFRCCGRLTPAATAEEKLEYLEMLWDNLPRLGWKHDLDAYARLQETLLQNGRREKAGHVMDLVREAGLEPDARMYFREVIRCVKDAEPHDLEKIEFYTRLVEERSSDQFVRRRLKGFMATAYANSGKEDRVKQLLAEASEDGDVSAINVYYFRLCITRARQGDTVRLFETISQARQSNANMSDGQLHYLNLVLAEAGHHDCVLRILSHIEKDQAWIFRTLSAVLRLIARGHYVTAMTILQRSSSASASCSQLSGQTSTKQSSSNQPEWLPTASNIYHFLLDLFHLRLPVGQIMAFCRRLADCGYRDDVFKLMDVAAFDMERQDVALMLGECETVPSSFSQSISHFDDGSKHLQRENYHRFHYSAALRFRGLCGNLEPVMRLLERMQATVPLLNGHTVQTMANDVLQYYSNGMDLQTIFAVFGSIIPNDVLLTAALCNSLRRGDGEGAKALLSECPRMRIHCLARTFIFALTSYYCKTHDLRLIIDILARIENRTIGSPVFELCLRHLIDVLREKISSDDLTNFIDGLSNAGIELRSRR